MVPLMSNQADQPTGDPKRADETASLVEAAEDLAKWAASQGTKNLDFTLDSLGRLDKLLERLSRSKDPITLKTRLGCAAYVGEVLVRRLGGSWGTGEFYGEVMPPGAAGDNEQEREVLARPTEMVERRLAEHVPLAQQALEQSKTWSVAESPAAEPAAEPEPEPAAEPEPEPAAEPEPAEKAAAEPEPAAQEAAEPEPEPAAEPEAEPAAEPEARSRSPAAEQAEADRLAAEQAEADRLAAEQAEADRLAAEQAEADRLAAEQAEADRLAAEKAAAEQAEAARLAAEQAEADRLAAEQAEADRLASEKAAAEQAEADRLAAEKAEADRLAAEQEEADRVAAEQAEADRLAAEKAEAVRLAAEQAEADRLAAEQAEADRLAAEKAAAEQAEADRLAAEQAEADRLAAEQAEADRVAAEQAAAMMRLVAETFVGPATANGAVWLDYSPASVMLLDDLIAAWWPATPEKGTYESMIPAMGAYVGEVLVRQSGGRWIRDPNEGYAVELSGRVVYPMKQVAGRFELGRAQSIGKFYTEASSGSAPAGKTPPEKPDKSKRRFFLHRG